MTATTMTAEQHRAAADAAEQRREESWQRSDTDGFLSQWASGLTAQLHRRQAEILDNGGVAEFRGLFDAATGERVKAKVVYVANPRGYGSKIAKWIVLDERDQAIEWIPAYKQGPRTKLAQRGYVEQIETAPAVAEITGSGTGLSGNAWVTTRRTDGGYPAGARTIREIRSGR